MEHLKNSLLNCVEGFDILKMEPIYNIINNNNYQEFIVEGEFYTPCMVDCEYHNITNINDFKNEFITQHKLIPICYEGTDCDFPVQVHVAKGLHIGKLNKKYNLGLNNELYDTLVIMIDVDIYNDCDIESAFEYQIDCLKEFYCHHNK